MGIYRRRFNDRPEDRDPNIMWTDWGESYIEVRPDGYAHVGDRMTVVTRKPDALIQAACVRFGEKADNGQFVNRITPAWKELQKELVKDPNLFLRFPSWPRRFEEFLAGMYFAAKWQDVIVTPPSNDRGYDVEARQNGRRVIDEAKAYSANRHVNHQVVRAILGVQSLQKDGPLARVSTTSKFAPTILKSAEFSEVFGEQLQLRSRLDLWRWLKSIKPN